MLYLAFEFNLYSPYLKENISFEEYTFLSIYIEGLNSIYLNKYSLRMYYIHETVTIRGHNSHPQG